MTKIERHTLAIVDDDDAVRDSLRFLLEVMGYRVSTFASAAEFLDADPTTIAFAGWGMGARAGAVIRADDGTHPLRSNGSTVGFIAGNGPS